MLAHALPHVPGAHAPLVDGCRSSSPDDFAEDDSNSAGDSSLTTRNAKGFTLVEVLIVLAVIGIIAAIAAPNLLRVRMSGNEASAIGSLKAINSAQVVYSSTCAQGGYAVDLA